MTFAGKIQIITEMLENKLITLEEAKIMFEFDSNDAFYVNCELE